MNYVDFGMRVRLLRQEQHITLETLAEKVGISASFLGHIERGTRVASLETLVRLCRALDTSPNHLLAFSLQGSAPMIPAGLDDSSRAQLAELLRQGYLLLQSPREE